MGHIITFRGYSFDENYIFYMLLILTIISIIYMRDGIIVTNTHLYVENTSIL